MPIMCAGGKTYVISSEVRDGLYWDRRVVREDHPSGESPRPWRKRIAALLDASLGVVVGSSVEVARCTDGFAKGRCLCVCVAREGR